MKYYVIYHERKLDIELITSAQSESFDESVDFKKKAFKKELKTRALNS